MGSKRDLVSSISEDDEPIKTGAGLAGFGKSVTPLTVAPVTPPTQARETFGFKCTKATKRRFARFAKWYNRNTDPADETPIGELAEEALIRFMDAKGFEEAPDGR